LDVPAIKLASTDLNNVPLVRRAAATGLPLIVSTGAATREEIERAVARLGGMVAGDHLILLHCVSGYPTPLHAANLGAIRSLCDLAGVPTGFSDHTTLTEIAGWAVAAGACVLEKHFTLDRGAAGPDHAMSLDPAGLAAYVTAARQAEIALGAGRLGMTSLEHDVRRVARKSVVVNAAIRAGTPLSAEMLAVKRPAGGIDPDRLDELVGRRATRDIAPNTVLTWDMLL
jgi:sialic acid synthase SpsE